MTSILFELGRDIVNEVQAGMKAHQDVKEGKEVERRQDRWGDPLAPKTVYSVVRGVEEALGMGKGKVKGEVKVKEPVKEVESDRERASSRPRQEVAIPAATDGNLYLQQQDETLDYTSAHQVTMTQSLASLHLKETSHSDTMSTANSSGPAISRPDDRIQLDSIGSPIPRESALPAHLRPSPPPRATQADKIQKSLETADDIAAEIALGVLIGGALDGPTQTLVEGLMALDDEETTQSKKNREALKKARKEIDKQTPKREELAQKLSTYQEKLDEPPGSRSTEKVEKDHRRLKEKIEGVKKELKKVEGKLEKAEWEVGKYKPRVEEHERLIREKRLKKVSEKREKEKEGKKM